MEYTMSFEDDKGNRNYNIKYEYAIHCPKPDDLKEVLEKTCPLKDIWQKNDYINICLESYKIYGDKLCVEFEKHTRKTRGFMPIDYIRESQPSTKIMNISSFRKIMGQTSIKRNK